MIGTIIGDYKIVQLLGEGGMGSVYKAIDLKLERYVALKILKQQTTHSPQFIERFKREAKNQAKLNHPNIISVYGFVDYQGILGIAMELSDGETLEKLIDKQGKLPLSQTISIVKQVLAGVGFAHQKGFIHRDIKPSNILIDSSGTIKIMDFGISKSIYEKSITKTGTKIGTIFYMSPEQIRAEEPTNQSDIYSIGITMFEMLNGLTPYEFPTEFEIMEGHLKKPIPKLSQVMESIPPSVDKVIAKACAKDPMARYMNCEDFSDDLDKLSLKITKQLTEELPPDQNLSVDVPVSRKIKLAAIFTGAIAAFILTVYLIYTAVTSMITIKPLTPGVNEDTTFSFKHNPAYTQKSNWAQIGIQIHSDMGSIYFQDINTGYAVGENGLLMTTVDGGESWTRHSLTDQGLMADSLLLINTALIKIDTLRLHDINFFSDGTGIIVGDRGTVLRMESGGTEWKQMKAPVNSTLFRFYPLTQKIGFVIGSSGAILKTIDAGENWTKVTGVVNEFLYGITFIDQNTGYIVGRNGTLLVTHNGGNEWESTERFTEDYLRDIAFLDEKKGFIVGAAGGMFFTDNGGESWKKIKSNILSGLVGVTFSHDKTGYIIGNKGEILKSTDGGKTWDIQSAGAYVVLTSLRVLNDGTVIICGSDGYIARGK